MFGVFVDDGMESLERKAGRLGCARNRENKLLDGNEANGYSCTKAEVTHGAGHLPSSLQKSRLPCVHFHLAVSSDGQIKATLVVLSPARERTGPTGLVLRMALELGTIPI